MKPNNLGKKYLVEQCQKISIFDYIKTANRELKKFIISSQLESEGLDIQLTTSNTGFGGVRFWFICPQCSRRVGVLYNHPISQILGCRVCLNLEYRCRRYKGMIEEKSG